MWFIHYQQCMEDAFWLVDVACTAVEPSLVDDQLFLPSLAHRSNRTATEEHSDCWAFCCSFSTIRVVVVVALHQPRQGKASMGDVPQCRLGRWQGNQ